MLDEERTILSQYLESVIDASFDGIVVTDGEGKILMVNSSYVSIIDIPKEEIIGRNVDELVEEGYFSQSSTRTAIVARRETVNMEQTYYNGKKILLNSTLIRDKMGRIALVSTGARNITVMAEMGKEVDGVTSRHLERYKEEMSILRQELVGSRNVIAHDDKMLEVISECNKVAKYDATVLIVGETGTGKEVIAHYIHDSSERKNKPFISVNCGAIPGNLLESELFGYEKGAFTGANSQGKPGLFEVASEGIIFLDEIGEMPLDLQVKLLRVLQNKEITRIGGIKSKKIDVRVIAATNRDLQQMVAAKEFREDLFYRLNVASIRIPPLRERKDDIFPLTDVFLYNINKKYGLNKKFTQTALYALKEYNWPGNVRELQNVIERVAIMSRGDLIMAGELPIDVFGNEQDESDFEHMEEDINLQEIIESVEFDFMDKAYKKYRSIRKAAASLGMTAPTFVRKRNLYLSKRSEIQGKSVPDMEQSEK